ncbi:MAG: DUF2934 domain-containing protein [Parvibaculum sp.]
MVSARGKSVSESEIRKRSYHIWEREGRPDGRHLDHWLMAQAELDAEGKAQARAPRRATKTLPGEGSAAKSTGSSKSTKPRTRSGTKTKKG